jgi:hypothetical protein
LQPQLYRSRSRLLISLPGNDYYAIDKGNQYFSSLLPKVAVSQKFFEGLFSDSQSNFNLDRSYFGSDYRSQMKTWSETLDIHMETQGIIAVDVYHRNPDQAKQISLALDNYLTGENQYFQEMGDKAKLEIIDQPIVSRYPVKPNLAGNALASLILGMIIGIASMFFKPKIRMKMKEVEGRVKKENKKVEYIPVENMDFLKENVVNIDMGNSQNQEIDRREPDAPIRGNIGNILK